jgi:hypothetical protein
LTALLHQLCDLNNTIYHTICIEFQEDEELIKETYQFIVPKDVHKLSFSDGAEYRANNPFTEWNDPKFEQQEKLTETRNIKVMLSSLFGNDVLLPDIIFPEIKND